MKLESKITCRACKKSIVGLELYTMFEEHARGLGWVKEVGYTLDTWLCEDCVKKRTNQEHTYSAGTSYATVTTYCDTCRLVHTGIDTGYKTAGYDLTKDGWVEVSQLTHRWRCPTCWRASLAEAQAKVKQAVDRARATVTTGIAETASMYIGGQATGGNVNVPTAKPLEREKQYPISLVFTSGQEEIYHVTEKTRNRLVDAVTSRQAIRFKYFIKIDEDEPSGVFACPADKIERMQ